MGKFFKESIIAIIISSVISCIVVIFSYFLIEKYKANESKINYTVDVIKLLSDIYPSVEVRIKKNGVDYKNNGLAITLNVKNQSVFPVNMSNPEVELFYLDQDVHVGVGNKLKKGVDYEIIANPYIGKLASGAKIEHSIGLFFKRKVFKDEKSIDRIFYNMFFQLETDRSIVKITREILKNHFDYKEVEKLSTIKTLVYGGLLIEKLITDQVNSVIPIGENDYINDYIHKNEKQVEYYLDP